MAEPTYEELKARLAEFERKAGRSGNLEFKVGEKGGVSVYGLGRFPVTLYYEQWIRLLDADQDLRAFLEKNKDKLKLMGTAAEVRISEGTLPRAEEERSSTLCQLCAGEPVSEPQKADASRDSVAW
jgi:hypothetical protein